MNIGRLAAIERELTEASRTAGAIGDAWRRERLEEAANAVASAMFGPPQRTFRIEPPEDPVPRGA